MGKLLTVWAALFFFSSAQCAEVKKLGDGNFVVDQSSIWNLGCDSKAFDSQLKLSKAADARIKVEYVKRGSIFNRLGLEKGDVLARIDGSSIESQAKAADLLCAAAQRGIVELVIERKIKVEIKSLPHANARVTEEVKNQDKIRRLSAGSYEVEREAAKKAFTADALLSACRLVSVSLNNGVRGMRLSSINHESALGALGFEGGDVITRIGGAEVYGAEEFFGGFASICEASKCRIEYSRKGKSRAVALAVK